MSNSNSSTATGGVGIFGLLTAILLVFKLAGLAGVSWGLANLSWFWVFAPLLAGLTIGIVALLIVLWVTTK